MTGFDPPLTLGRSAIQPSGLGNFVAIALPQRVPKVALTWLKVRGGMGRGFNRSGLVSAFLCVGAAMLPAPYAYAAGPPSADVYRMLELFGASLDALERRYEKPVDSAALVRAALSGMLASLDTQSSYLSPEEIEQVKSRVRREPTQAVIDGVLVLTIPEFSSKVADVVQGQISRILIEDRSIAGAVIDLRGNEGGRLEEVTKLADLFLDGGVILTTHGREGENRYMATAGDVLDGLPLVVVVDGKTAMGAEMVAGALQDRGRGKLVGERSAGIAAVTTEFPLGRNGSDGYLRFTTSQARLPSGRSFAESGLIPDYAASPAQGTRDVALEEAFELIRR